MSELAGHAAGGHAMDIFSDFDITNAAELEAHVNIRAIAARRNFDKYYAERLTDVSKLWVDQKRRLDVRQPFEVPTVTVSCAKSKFDFATIVPTFEEEARLRQAQKAEREQKRAAGDNSVDLEIDTRFDQNKALRLKLTGVDYTNVDKVVAALVAPPGCSALEIDLSNNGLSEDDGESLGKLCETNKTMTTLDLSGNPLNTAGIEKVCAGLLKNVTLTSLDLGAAEISKSGVVHLAAVLARPDCPLQRLQLGGNKLGIYGAEVLAAALQGNKSLKALGLQNNNLGDDGVAKLLDIAFHGGPDGNSTIVQLNIESNKTTDGGSVTPLLKAVWENEKAQARVYVEALEERERANRTKEIDAEWEALSDLIRRAIVAIRQKEDDAKKAAAAPPLNGPAKAAAGKAGKCLAAPATNNKAAPASAPSSKKQSASPTKAPAKSPVKSPSGAPSGSAKGPGAKAPAGSGALMSAKVAAAAGGKAPAARTPSPAKKK